MKLRSCACIAAQTPIANNVLSAKIYYRKEEEKVKEADLYSAFIEVPYTQGAQVQITQCYLQTTPLHQTANQVP